MEPSKNCWKLSPGRNSALHAKPCILINTAGYWNGLLAFLDTAVAAGFLKPKNRKLLLVADNARNAVALAKSLIDAGA